MIYHEEEGLHCIKRARLKHIRQIRFRMLEEQLRQHERWISRSLSICVSTSISFRLTCTCCVAHECSIFTCLDGTNSSNGIEQG